MSLISKNRANNRWLPFDPSRNFPDLGPRFMKGEKALRDAQKASSSENDDSENNEKTETVVEDMDDEVDLSWATVMKRSFEGYIRAERPNMYGEWLQW
jgi:WD repeat and SOF domain-containing protein 1